MQSGIVNSQMNKLRIVQVEAILNTTGGGTDAPMVQIRNSPPRGLECPDFEEAKLLDDVFLIETDSREPNDWAGCRVYWKDSYWKIELSQMISNGAQALITVIPDVS